MPVWRFASVAALAVGRMSFYRGATALFGIAFLGIGIALLVVTAAHGGGMLGYVLGVLFGALGIGRLYLLRSRTRRDSHS